MKFKFSIRAVLILVTLLGGLFAFIHWNDPVTRYRRNHDAASLRAILSRRARNGDTIARIQDLLGPAKQYTDAGFKSALTAHAHRNPSSFPDGVAEIDAFYEFAEGPNMATILQFRNGRMVNFDPKEFQEPSRVGMALE